MIKRCPRYHPGSRISNRTQPHPSHPGPQKPGCSLSAKHEQNAHTLRNSNKFPATYVCLTSRHTRNICRIPGVPFNAPSADHYSCQHTIRLSPARTLCGCPSRFTPASTVYKSYLIVVHLSANTAFCQAQIYILSYCIQSNHSLYANPRAPTSANLYKSFRVTS